MAPALPHHCQPQSYKHTGSFCPGTVLIQARTAGASRPGKEESVGGHVPGTCPRDAIESMQLGTPPGLLIYKYKS